MKAPTDHLELVFLATTVTQAWGTGWAFTNTTVPRPRAVVSPAAPRRFRLALLTS